MDEVIDVSEQTLKNTPERALAFLRGVGTNDTIRAILARVGYLPKEHAEGWKLLQACSGYDSTGGFEPANEKVSNAINQLDAWDERGFRVINASLARHFPEQAAFVMQGLAPAQGAAAVIGVSTLLARLDQLEHAAERKATRKQDAEALDLLATRGITAAKRKELAELVKVAQSAQPISIDPKVAEDRQHRQLEALAELRKWFTEWAEVARAEISRRDYLITLGLAQRRVAKPTDPQTVGPNVGPTA